MRRNSRILILNLIFYRQKKCSLAFLDRDAYFDYWLPEVVGKLLGITLTSTVYLFVFFGVLLLFFLFLITTYLFISQTFFHSSMSLEGIFQYITSSKIYEDSNSLKKIKQKKNFVNLIQVAGVHQKVSQC